MTLNAPLLNSSFELVAPEGDRLMSAFYDSLFEKNPDVRPLFSGVKMQDQKRKLLASLKLVVSSLDDLDALAPKIKELGKRHAAYGALDSHYPAVGEALLHALASTAGERWTPEMTGAWKDAYGLLSSLMIEGSRSN